ncbi:hypothetical protein D9M69_733160 [compost metagenome]
MAPSARITAPKFGPSAVSQGGHLPSMPTFRASWLSMKKPTPSRMPRNTLAPTPPRRVCIRPMGAAMVIMTSKVNGYASLRHKATTCRPYCSWLLRK